MSAVRPLIPSAYIDHETNELVVLADGRPVLRMTLKQAAWLIARAAEALATSHSLSQAAVRLGCAGDGEGAMPSSPDLPA